MLTTHTIERDICHQCEISKPYKELATFKDSEGRTNFFSPIICVDCHNKKDFIEWKKVINNKANEVNIYSCICPKCEAKKTDYDLSKHFNKKEINKINEDLKNNWTLKGHEPLNLDVLIKMADATESKQLTFRTEKGETFIIKASGELKQIN